MCLKEVLCSYYVVCHHAEIKEVRVCVWKVINNTLVDKIIQGVPGGMCQTSEECSLR